jgi:hypothetical protein
MILVQMQEILGLELDYTLIFLTKQSVIVIHLKLILTTTLKLQK